MSNTSRQTFLAEKDDSFQVFISLSATGLLNVVLSGSKKCVKPREICDSTKCVRSREICGSGKIEKTPEIYDSTNWVKSCEICDSAKTVKTRVGTTILREQLLDSDFQ